MMRAGLAAGLLLLAAFTVDATMVVRQTITATPSAALPVLLTSAGEPTTTLGASGTSAVTTGADLPVVGAVTALQINRGAVGWSVQIRATGASGVSGLEAATVALVGATTQSLLFNTGTTYPVTSGTVSLPTTGPDILVTAAGVACTCTFTLQLLIFPPGATSPTLTYNYSLTTI